MERKPRREGIGRAVAATARRAVTAVTMLLVVALPATRAGGDAEPRVHGTYRGDPMYTVLPLDAIPAIRAPEYVGGAAARRQMAQEEPVIGLVVDGQARAYSTWQLDFHEIVNDEISGVPLAVTWCPLCHTGIVYDRRVAGRTLTFLVSGKLWRNSLVMQDEQTGTLWSHVSGEALDGPLEGERVRKLHAVQTTWESWSGEHPETLVLHKPQAVEGSRYESYAEDPDRFGIIRAHRQLRKLPGKTLVHGVSRGDDAVAVPDAALGRGDSLRVALDGEHVVVFRAADGGVRARVARDEGELLPVTTAYWFAWVSFHPNSEVASGS